MNRLAMKNMMATILAAIFFTLIFSAAASAQEDMTIQISTFGRQASFISDQQSLHLQIVEGNKQIDPENIAVESIDQIILAIDTSDSMKYILPKMLGVVKKSLPDHPAAPIMIATFNHEAQIVADFTTSHDKLAAALNNVHSCKQETRIFAAVQSLQKLAGNKRTHIILITDGTDTSQEKVNIRNMLVQAHTSISYINWGIGDTSKPVDEPGYQPTAKSGMVKINPNSLLAQFAQTSGGDVMNFTDWKAVSHYFQQRLNAGGFLYQLFWHTDNPERSFHIQTESQQILLAMKNF